MSLKSEQFEIFRNEVFCRHDSNQRRAIKIWNTINGCLPDEMKQLFEVEWYHYLHGEFKPELFGSDLRKIEQYFYD